MNPPRKIRDLTEARELQFEKEVFVVHGHDEATREKVARFIERLQCIPVILHEQPNAGRTIIEKFEEHAHVSFAVILLTGDDIGGDRKLPPDEYKPRARQNVIFELGFFIGRLGRKNVCALYAPGVEIPSDYQGVLFIQIDEDDKDNWRIKLAKEMRAAGLSVDLNDII